MVYKRGCMRKDRGDIRVKERWRRMLGVGLRMANPLGQSVFKCSSTGCGSTFKKEWRLVEHMYQHTGQKPWMCNKPQCGAAYSKKAYLQRHQQCHFGLKKHKCPKAECRAAFWTKKCLKRHLVYKHGGDAPLKCSIEGCNGTFRKRHALRTHLAEHSKGLGFVCNVDGCNKILQSAVQLPGHLRRHRGYKCPYPGCQTLFPTWSALQKHRKKHPMELQCAKCSKNFKTQNSLRRHKASHAKVPVLLSCPRDNCKETFGTVFNLTHHVRKVHLGLQTHRCYHSGCNRTFCMRESLLRHLVCHDPERKKLKLKFVMPKKPRYQGANRTLPSVEQDLSRLFNEKLRSRFRILKESNLSGLFNERQLRDPADPEANLSGLFQLPPNRIKVEKRPTFLFPPKGDCFLDCMSEYTVYFLIKAKEALT
uniref:C2H2-type domain-containing protein n=1 Tax=Leptobrachium leishanense TaxID=445787 RepID=A0A8C5QZK3_9ANUR